MSEDVPPYRAIRLGPAGRTVTPAEARELRGLYDKLANASAAAGEVLGRASGVPTGAALQRFRELDAYIETIMDRIKEILG
jgi:hypothetical protein